MRRCSSVLAVVVGLLVANMFFAGCGGGGSDKEAPSATGTWGFAAPTGEQETMTLAESGGAISGTSTRGATVTGTRNGPNANIELHYANNYVITFVVVIDGGTMTGTVTDSNGGTGTVVIIRIDTDGNIKAGTYTGTEHVTIGASGVPSMSFDSPIQFVVSEDGQVMLPDVSGDVAGGGHFMTSHTQTGNQFSLTATVSVAGAGSFSFTYAGTVNGDLITGTISGSGMAGLTMTGTFEATRD